MSSNDTPAAAVGRTFQVWDYSPSHRTLLLRSPASDSHVENFDLRFTGVSHIDLPTRFVLTSITGLDLESERERRREFLLIHGEGHGVVSASKLHAESNAKGLFEALSDASSRTQDSFVRFESDVLLALKSALPDAQVALSEPGKPDIEVTRNGRRVFVDAMWTSESAPARQVRSRVMSRVSRWNRDDLSRTPLILVVGGLRADEVAAVLPDHVVTALGARAEAVVWDVKGRSILIDRVEAALDRNSGVSLNKFEVLKDSGGNYRWRLRAGNGAVLAVSDPYATIDEASTAARAMQSSVNKARLVVRADSLNP